MDKLNIETRRLHIRHLKESDLADFYAYRSLPEVARYQGFGVMDKTQAKAFIESHARKLFGKPGIWVQYALEEKTSQRLIGDCAIKLNKDEPRIAQIGITLNPDFQKKGFAKEAMTGIINWLFYTKNIHRITELIDLENLASIHLLESLGFKKEGHFVDSFFDAGKWGSEFQYALLKKDWRITG